MTDSDPTHALYRLIGETRALFHRLREAANELHGEGFLTAARRGVLESLEHRGPQTIPQLARARPVSRQHIQALVATLQDDGLVEQIPNPAHKRSFLIRLTEAGHARIGDMTRREAQALSRLEWPDPRDLRSAADTLARVRATFAGSKWSGVARDSGVAAGG